jgi:cytidylate kinase
MYRNQAENRNSGPLGRMPIVTVSGPAGSGKSTYAQKLANHFELQYISAGTVFRQLAKEKGITLAEMSDLCESDHSIDHIIDDRIKEKAAQGNVVADGRLTGFMLHDVADLKIYVTAPPHIRILRVMQRDGVSETYATEETRSRDESEKKRFEDIYQIDISSLAIYDIVLNTGKWSKDAVSQLLIQAVQTLNQK